MKAVLSYFSEVKEELSRVVWPKRQDVIKLTLMVFLISGIIGIYVGLLDFTFTKLLEYVVSNI